MGKKTHKTAVVLIPPIDLWPPIQAIRQKYDRHVTRWMPHITLIYPFRPQEEFEVLARRFSEICENIGPFEVELARFYFTQHNQGRYTLWLSPEPKENLVRLQTLLWSAVPDCDDVRRYKDGFTPHLSVGQARGGREILNLQKLLQAAWKPLSFIVHEVSIISRGEPPDDVFRVARKIVLGK